MTDTYTYMYFILFKNFNLVCHIMRHWSIFLNVVYYYFYAYSPIEKENVCGKIIWFWLPDNVFVANVKTIVKYFII